MANHEHARSAGSRVNFKTNMQKSIIIICVNVLGSPDYRISLVLCRYFNKNEELYPTVLTILTIYFIMNMQNESLTLSLHCLAGHTTCVQSS